MVCQESHNHNEFVTRREGSEKVPTIRATSSLLKEPFQYRDKFMRIGLADSLNIMWKVKNDGVNFVTTNSRKKFIVSETMVCEGFTKK
jgi:ABC-type nitrate/sulfonate/bicarbonate transport system ATPase subunit